MRIRSAVGCHANQDYFCRRRSRRRKHSWRTRTQRWQQCSGSTRTCAGSSRLLDLCLCESRGCNAHSDVCRTGTLVSWAAKVQTAGTCSCQQQEPKQEWCAAVISSAAAPPRRALQGPLRSGLAGGEAATPPGAGGAADVRGSADQRQLHGQLLAVQAAREGERAAAAARLRCAYQYKIGGVGSSEHVVFSTLMGCQMASMGAHLGAAIANHVRRLSALGAPCYRRARREPGISSGA